MGNSPPSSIFRREHLRQAAAANMLIIRACRHCKHEEVYVAADLLLVYGDKPVESFGGGDCSKCGGRHCAHAFSHFPQQSDVGRRELMRPAGWQKKWSWRREWLELPLQALPEDIDQAKSAGELDRRTTPPPVQKFEDWTKPVGSGFPRKR